MARTTADDVSDLAQAALRAITSALRDGEAKYQPGDWLAYSEEEHHDHARFHARVAESSVAENHLTHQIARAVMAFAQRERATRKAAGELLRAAKARQ